MQNQICTCLSKKQILTTLKKFWYLELTHFLWNCQMLINSTGLLSRAEHSSSLCLGRQQWHPQRPWQAWLWLWALSPGLLLAAGCSLLGKGAGKFQLSLIPLWWSKDTEAPQSRSPACAFTKTSLLEGLSLGDMDWLHDFGPAFRGSCSTVRQPCL